MVPETRRRRQWDGGRRPSEDVPASAAVVRTGAMTGNAVRVVSDSPQGELVLVAGRVDVVADGASATFSPHRH